MAHHQSKRIAAKYRHELVVPTRQEQWVIPYNCEILKALLVQQNIHASDMYFKSSNQCQRFIKELILLAAQDECRTRCPSNIATLARELMIEPDSVTTTKL